ncbi:MAG: AraC family transcriptional regulator [Victivallales bacterium]|nr:AraC family transcriptional regulator [Victivallales bacterium]
MSVAMKALINLNVLAENISLTALLQTKALGMELLGFMAEDSELKENAMFLLNQNRKEADTIDFIENHLKNNITVTELAQKACLSVSRFHRVFKQATGQSPGEFITKKRLAKAQSLLATTDMSMMEIAEETGFANVYYFSRIFKKYIGQPPASYRKLLENQIVF